MAAKIYYQEDCNLSLLEGKKIAIIGYGSQGHAHALNLKESGCDVIVGLYEGSKSWAKAEAQGLKVYTAAEAAKQADIRAQSGGRQHADVRTWFLHPFRTDRSAGKCGCNHDRSKGSRPHSKK